MDNYVLKPVWSTLKPVILVRFLTGANSRILLPLEGTLKHFDDRI
jgi:hypothetical protein